MQLYAFLTSCLKNQNITIFLPLSIQKECLLSLKNINTVYNTTKYFYQRLKSLASSSRSSWAFNRSSCFFCITSFNLFSTPCFNSQKIQQFNKPTFCKTYNTYIQFHKILHDTIVQLNKEIKRFFLHLYQIGIFFFYPTRNTQ